MQDHSNVLSELVKTPTEQRDKAWDKQFLDHLAHAGFMAATPPDVTGPDGYPYFQLLFQASDSEAESFCIANRVDDYLLEKGVGVTINSASAEPDWVLSYGDIVHYHLHQSFADPTHNFCKNEQDEQMTEEMEVVTENPSESLLPLPTRAVLDRFFKECDIDDGKVLLFKRTQQGKTVQDLAFNVTPDDFESLDDFNDFMLSLSWFLPNYFTIVGLDEQDYPEAFTSL